MTRPRQVFSAPSGSGPTPVDGPTRLQMARLVGAVAVAVLAQFAVSMPNGYFGPSDHITPFGVVYSVSILVLLLTAVLAMRSGSRWSTPLAVAVLAVNVGLFIPPLSTNPVIAGVVVLWNFFLLSHTFLATRRGEPEAPRHGLADQNELAEWLGTNAAAVRHLVSLALIATVAVVGYEIGSKVPAQVVCIGLQVLAIVPAFTFLRKLFVSNRWAALGPPLLVVAAIATAFEPTAALALLAAFDVVILVQIAARSALFAEVLQHFFGRPALLVLISFVILIAFGTLLLTFPIASAHPQPLTPVNALFTATSASCVTGLIVIDTPKDLSFFGQLVVLLLIQAGGLNIMVLSTFAALLLGRGIGLRGERALGALLDLPSVSAAYRLIGFIVVVTLAVESAGAGVLALVELDRGTAPVTAVWRAVFHSVSAFCNAGFALYSDSLVGYQGQPLVLLVMAALITLGGLGFAVLAFAWLRLRSSARVGLSTQVRVVLLASAALTALGFAAVAAAEWRHGLGDLGTLDKLVNALFQSVTCRTAGFNSIGIDGLQPITLLLFMVLMFVGASPGGTGGGIKTTTLVVLLSAIPAIASGRTRVVLMRRTISLDTVFRSAAVAVVATMVIVIGAGALLALQGGPLVGLVFEAVSAFGTVGLSLGQTAALASPGKLVLVLVMLVGRIGPLSLALLLGRKQPSAVDFPEARIMVG